MSSKRRTWKRFGRYLTGVMIACFFLPFFGISCKGMDALRLSGADMVGGCRPGGLLMDETMSRGHEGRGDHGGLDTEQLDHTPRQPFAFGALAIIVAIFGLAVARKRGTLAATCLLAVIGLGCMAGLFLKVHAELNDAVEAGGPGGSRGAGMARDMMEGVESGSRFGFWLVCLELAGVAGITFMAMREPELPDDEPERPPHAPPPVPTV